MPRSGSGVYSPTAGIPVVSGTTISSTVFNNLVTDIGTEITGSLPVNGAAPMTGTLRAVLGSVSAPGYTFVGDTDTGIYSPGANQLVIGTGGTAAVTFSSTQTTAWTAKAVGKAFDVDAITSVASASTCDIGAAATSEVLITGTTTITSFGTSNAGIRRRGTFAGALTLTHNATSLILPGGANITTVAGDAFEAVSLGSGNWRVTSYQTGSVNAPVFMTAQATTSGTSIDFTGIPASAKRITVIFNGVSTNGTDSYCIRVGSGSITSTGYVSTSVSINNASATAGGSATSGFVVAAASASTVFSGHMVLTLISGTTWIASGQGKTLTTNVVVMGGDVTLGGALDRLRLTTLSGTDTFDAGSVSVIWE